MEINSDRTNDILIIIPEGRLDAFGAQEFEEALKELIQEDDFTVIIDMGDVPYLSSGGIRTLLAAEKRLKKRDGGIHLCNLDTYPLKVLEMAGFDQFFSIYPTKEDAIKNCRKLESMRKQKVDWDHLPTYQNDGAKFTIFETSKEKTLLKATGDISKVLRAQLEEEDIFSRRFSETEYSIGLGGLGGGVRDCMDILGEMITIGGTMVWLPTDGHDTPDFLIPKKDTGKVTIYTGFNAALDGTFNDIMVMESAQERGITLSEIYENIFEVARENRENFKGLVSLAMLAEVGEAYSSGVKISPIRKFAPKNREMIMHEDNVGEWIDINNVPKYSGEIMVSFGLGLDLSSDISSFDRDAVDSLFYLHPANVGNKKMLLHNHGVFFKHLPLANDPNLDEDIKKTVTEGEFLDMRHLLDNTRVTRAVIGVSYISDIVFEKTMGLDIIGECVGWNETFAKIAHKLHPDCSEVQLTTLAGGYSGSLVFRVNSWDRSGRKEMPFVLKMGVWSEIHDEIQGYEDHVKRYIQNNATQIIDYCKIDDFGGILYNFVGIKGADSEIFCLEDYYNSHSTEDAISAFDRLFRVVLKTWYGQPRLKETSLYEEYGHFFNYEVVSDYAQNNFGASPDDESIELPFGLGKSANPLYFVEKVIPERKSETMSVYEASVHGDLNMKNVLMDEENNMWLIDFSETEHSHILRDIAKLETVLKFEMTDIKSREELENLVEMEKIFLDPKTLNDIPRIPFAIEDPKILKAFQCARRLREYVDVITLLDEDISQYFFSLLSYTLCVVGYGSVNDYAKEYAWISSSMLCQKLV
jgi:anti-anti-sigma factor